MKNSEKNKISLSYASAMYEAAHKTNEEEKVLADVRNLQEALSQDSHIMNMLTNPLWSGTVKQEAINEIGTALGLCRVTVNALNEIAVNGRLNLLSFIFKDYIKLYNIANNIAEVSVKSAVELDREQNQNLRTALEKWLNKKVVINYKIEPELLGGLLIEYGSIMLDDSVKGKLEKLKDLMKGNK